LAVGQLSHVVGGVVGVGVVAGAEQPAVCDRGATAEVPGGLVVGVAHAGGPVAAFGGAALLLDREGDALGLGVEAPFPAEVEDFGVAAEDGGDDPGLAGQSAGQAGGDAGAGVELGGLEPADQGL